MGGDSSVGGWRFKCRWVEIKCGWRSSVGRDLSVVGDSSVGGDSKCGWRRMKIRI